MSDISTRRITRDKLAAIFKSHEMVKLIENLTIDVIDTLPGRIEATLQTPLDGIGSSLLSSDVSALLQLPQAISMQIQEITTELAGLREQMAILRTQINDINQRVEL